MQMFVVLLKTIAIFFISLKLEVQLLFFFSIGYFNATAIGGGVGAKIASHRLEIFASKAIPSSQSYMSQFL